MLGMSQPRNGDGRLTIDGVGMLMEGDGGLKLQYKIEMRRVGE